MPFVELHTSRQEDAESLVALRIAAMQESLTRIGRFDPLRARDRFLAGFEPSLTQHIVWQGQRVGFVVVKPQDNALLLDHLYIHPDAQGRGIGSEVLYKVFSRANASSQAVRVGALRESASNQFYQRHGFVLTDSGEFDHYYVRHPVSPVRGILFDLDETLINRRDSLNEYAKRLYADYLSDCGEDFEHFIATFHQLDANGSIRRPVFLNALATHYPVVSLEALTEHFFTQAWTTPMLFSGVKEMLHTLRQQGWTLGLVTNGSGRLQRQKIANTDLAEYFDHIVISDEFGRHKPDVSIFQHMLERLNLDPQQSWFIGDRPDADMLGAYHTGLRAIWIRQHYPWPTELAVCYTHQINDVRECVALVNGE